MTTTASLRAAHAGPAMERAIRNEDSLARDFLTIGVDDLAKYHIVRLLCREPSMAGDAAHYAAHCGFHSTEVTVTLLEELVAVGLLAKEHSNGACWVRYRLTDDSGVRRRLIRLYNPAVCLAERESLLHVLACRSLKRAYSRASAAEREARAAKQGAVQLSGNP